MIFKIFYRFLSEFHLCVFFIDYVTLCIWLSFANEMLEIWPFRRGCDFHSIDKNMYIFIIINIFLVLFFLLIWIIWTYWFSTVQQFQIKIHKAIIWPFMSLPDHVLIFLVLFEALSHSCLSVDCCCLYKFVVI